MGLSLSWIAANGLSRPDLLKALGLAEFGASYRGSPVPVSAKYVVFDWDGWILVAAHHVALANRSRVRTASLGGAAVGAYLEEHVMISGAFAADEGELVWSVQHDPNIAPDHLDVWGRPPAILEEIRSRLTGKSHAEPDVDFLFDAPTELAANRCGFDPNRFDTELDLTALTVTRPDLMSLCDPLLASEITDPSGAIPEARRLRPGLIARLFGLG